MPPLAAAVSVQLLVLSLVVRAVNCTKCKLELAFLQALELVPVRIHKGTEACARRLVGGSRGEIPLYI